MENNIRIKIDKYSQYFTVTSITFSQLIFLLYGFNKRLKTYSMGLQQVGKNRPPKVVKKLNQEFYIIENENPENPNSKNLIRYNINIYNSFIQYLKDNDIVIDNISVKEHKPFKGRSVTINMNPTLKQRDYQKSYIDKIVTWDNNSLLIDLQTGKGKALVHGSKVLTPNGWTKIENIKVDDLVMGSKGNFIKVTGVYPQGKRELIEFRFSDGRTSICDMEHLWSFRQDFNKRYVTFTASTMKELIDNGSILSIPLLDLDLKKDDYYSDKSIHPYILGILLAGKHPLERLYLDLQNKETVNKVKKLLPDTHKLKRYEYNTYQIVTELDRDPLIKELFNLKLNLVNFTTAHIPKEYLKHNCSINDRLLLLRGMVESSGIVIGPETIRLKVLSYGLYTHIRSLVHSLGGICEFVTEKSDRYSFEYTLDIKFKDITKIYTNKNINVDPIDDLSLSIIDYYPIGEDYATCISVDSDDKLYVIDDYILTHNTFIAMNGVSLISEAFSMVVLPRYIDKWIGDIKYLTDIKDEEICVIQGVKNLLSVLTSSKEVISKYKCFILSLTTMNLFIKAHLNNDIDFELGITPESLFERLGTSVVLNDETHQEFHNIYKLMLYSNVKLFLGMTATLITSDNDLERMYNHLYPDTNRISNIIEYDRYIDIYSVRYRFKHPRKVRFKNNYGYNQSILEKYIAKNSYILANYLEMIYRILKSDYIKRMNNKDNDKALIFAGTVDMCRIIVDYLMDKHPELKINKYTEEDDYEIINQSDIIVSTTNSLGTAIDIPNLISTIMTVNVNSPQINTQSLGRLRKLDKPTKFYYLWCNDIRPHKKYNADRLVLFRPKAKTINLLEYNKLL